TSATVDGGTVVALSPGGTLIFDPPTSTPDAIAIPVVDSSTLTTTETAGSQTDVTSATVDDGTVVTLSPGGTSIFDPPTSTLDATAIPVVETATETTSNRRKVASAADDEAMMVALSTAIAVALSAAVSDANGKEI